MGCLLLQGAAADAQNTTVAGEKHYNIGLTYPISSNGTGARYYTNTFSLNAVVGLSASEKGVSIAGVSNIILDSAAGLQIAGFSNHIYNDAQGVQVAGFMNVVRNGSSGLLVAGFMNRSGNSGTQVAGFINIAKKVKGLQIAGFINIADSSDYPIGIVNIIRNGEKAIGVSTDETLTTFVSFRSGGHKLYGIVGLGYNNKGQRQLAAWEAGIGWHLITWGDFRLNTELVNIGLSDFSNGDCMRSSLRILPAFRLGQRIELFAGPSFNYLRSDKGQGTDLVTHYLWSDTNKNKELHGLYFGFMGGLSVAL